MRRLFWHEFGHSFVNHLTERHIESLLAPAEALLGDQAQPDQLEAQVAEFVSEQILRAATTRLAYLRLGEAAGDAALDFDTTERFPFVAALCRALERYEANRDRYSTLADFYPELIRAFEDVAADLG